MQRCAWGHGRAAWCTRWEEQQLRGRCLSVLVPAALAHAGQAAGQAGGGQRCVTTAAALLGGEEMVHGRTEQQGGPADQKN